jgi:glycosyltransferase involved in cell wall biosynthesis
MEGLFRGAGWNVIKVIWGSYWDSLLEKYNTGILMKRMESVGVTHQTSMASIVYHFQCGEKDDDSIGHSKKIVKIAICNDNCDGQMGEKVLWNHLLENIAGAYRVDKNLIGKYSFELKARDYITLNHPETQIIVQNASFIDRIDKTKYSILFLQDNLRSMGRSSVQQESNLKFADVLVTNSIQTSMSYPEYDFEIIPIGINSDLFKPKNKSNLRTKYDLKKEGKVGIFVGSFSDVKGWKKVLECIRYYRDITWILITKFKNEECMEENVLVFKHLKQDVLSELLNCADFFIIGSPEETQCLAALEANFCNVPVVMPLVGIYKDFSEEERISVGVFGDDLIGGVRQVLKKNYEPRITMLSKGLGIEDTIIKWNALIDKSCYEAKLKQFKNFNNSTSHSFLFSIFFKVAFLTRTILIRYFLGENYWKICNLMSLSRIKSVLRNFLIKINLLNFAKKILDQE